MLETGADVAKPRSQNQILRKPTHHIIQQNAIKECFYKET